MFKILNPVLLFSVFVPYVGVFGCLFRQLRGISGDRLLNQLSAESSDRNDRVVGYVENCREHVHLEVQTT